MTEQPTHPTHPAHPAHPIETIPAEARPYQGQRAGIVTRVVANIIDVAVVVAILIGTYFGVAAAIFVVNPRSFSMPAVPPLWLVLLIGLWVQGIYFALSWAITGRTYGDHLMGLRVVNIRGRRMNIVGAGVRAATCVVFPIGLFWIIVSGGNRSLQDVAMRTSVVYDWAAHPKPEDNPLPADSAPVSLDP